MRDYHCETKPQIKPIPNLNTCEQAVALALYADYRAPARAADAAEARRLQAAFAARVRGMHARYEHGTLFQGDAAPGCLADGAPSADRCATCARVYCLLKPPLSKCCACVQHAHGTQYQRCSRVRRAWSSA